MLSTFERIKAAIKKAYANALPDRKGLVFIADISGFTELVANTNMIIGKKITYELLSAIIKHNRLKMEVAEIEGDAVFFFKLNHLPDSIEIMGQFKTMKNAFDQTRLALELKYNLKLNLQLKAVAHYGIMAEYYLGGFRKLYGQVVVEAHRLLKNNIPQSSYLLITDELSEACAGKNFKESLIEMDESTKLCEMYQDLRNICYSYTSFDKSFATNYL